MRRRRFQFFLSCGIAACAALASGVVAADETARTPPPVMLANVYHGDVQLGDFLVSEKLDGVRAWWDGEKLITRGGSRINPPVWFTQDWPKVPLDGELWAGRGQFSKASSAARKQAPDDDAWREVHFMVFDLPTQPGTFVERLAALKTLLAKPLPHLRLVEQFKVADQAELDRRLDQIVALGGEGLVLHRGASLYRAERNDDLLKFKRYDDAEAKVIGHLPGEGKYVGMLGALLVQRPDGLEFRIGTGFSDEERRHPPPLGVWVTYRYNGETESGVPRFASFMRVREEMPPPEPRQEPGSLP